MKSLLVAVFVFGMGTSGLKADPMLPPDMVKAAIASAKEDKLERFIQICDLVKIANHQRHPLQPDEMVKLLKGLNPDSIAFKPIEYKKAWAVGDIYIVRLTAPKSLDFDVELRSVPDGEPRFVITGIHP